MAEQDPGALLLETRDPQIVGCAGRLGLEVPVHAKGVRLQSPKESVDKLIEDICFISHRSSGVCSS